MSSSFAVGLAPRFFALVPCAGIGARAGAGGPKQYAALAGRPLVAHTLAALQQVPRLDATLVVLAPDDAQFEAAHRAFMQPFDMFVTADRIRAHKPDLWHFRAFQLLAQVRKDDWIHVASDWERDIVPAEIFGVQRVWLDRDGTGEDPSHASAHVRSAADAGLAIDWLFQDCAACAS